MEKEQILDVSWSTIFKLIVAVFVFWFLYITQETVVLFLFALAISVLLTPAVSFLKKLWMPRVLAVLIVYLSIFGVLGLLVYLISPLFITELKQLSQNLPSYFIRVSPFLQQIGIDTAQTFDNFTQILVVWLYQSSRGVLNAVMAFFGGLYSTAFILTAAFFLSLEDNAFEKFLILISPKKYEENIASLFDRAQNKVSRWFGVRVVSCVFVGLASYLVFALFGVKYALILALISGFLNFIPYIGPWVTATLLVVFVSVSSGSWLEVLYVLLAVLLVQEVDNKILTPLLMKKLVDVPPVLVLVSLLIGGQLFGFLGVIFAVPVFGIIYEFLKEFLEKKKEESEF